MKCEVKRKELLAALADAAKLVKGQNRSMPILGMVRLETRGMYLGIQATTLTTWTNANVRAVCHAGGVICIDPIRLADACKAQDGDSITLGCDGTTLRTGGSVLSVVPADEYAAIPDWTPPEFPYYDPAELSSALTGVAYAASRDDTRYNLNGVYLEPEAGGIGLTLTATDGHRLATARIGGIGQRYERKPAILPLAAVDAILRALKRLPAVALNVPLTWNDKRWFCVAGITYLSGDRIDGDYPDWRQVVPKSFSARRTFDGPELVAALKAASKIASERDHEIKLEDAGGGNVVLSTSNPDAGEYRVTLAADGSEPFGPIAFNASYLLQACIGWERIVIRFKDPLSPALLCSEGDAETFAVVMPMRL